VVDRAEKMTGDNSKLAAPKGGNLGRPFDNSLSYHVRTVHRLIERYLQQKTQPHGITIGMWYFLRALWHHDGLTQRELSEVVGAMEPTTQSAIKSMEHIGLVRRVRNVQDRRMINVYLTPRGQALKEKLLPVALQVSEGAIAGLSPREREMFLELLRVIQKNLRTRIAEHGDDQGIDLAQPDGE